MILDKNEIDARLDSPLNLLNRLRKLTSVENKIVTIPDGVGRADSNDSRNQHPSLPPDIDELVDNVQDKLATAKCYSGAKEVLAKSINRLNERLEEVDSPVQLSRIATDMGKIVNGFDENKKEKVSNIIPIIYRPVMLTEQSFQVINVES